MFDPDTLPVILQCQNVETEVDVASWLESRHSQLEHLSQLDVLQTHCSNAIGAMDAEETHNNGLRDIMLRQNKQESGGLNHLCLEHRTVTVTSCVADCIANHLQTSMEHQTPHFGLISSMKYYSPRDVTNVTSRRLMLKHVLRRNLNFSILVATQGVCPTVWSDVLSGAQTNLCGWERFCFAELLPYLAVLAVATRQATERSLTEAVSSSLAVRSSSRSRRLNHRYEEIDDNDLELDGDGEERSSKSRRKFLWQHLRDTLLLCCERDTEFVLELGRLPNHH
jgi:hypothetical protein